jgi:urease accessory protein
MTNLNRSTRALLVAGLTLASTPALAHHAMDGKLPATFAEGLLSGLGHPVIGPDHLAFLVATGIAAALVPAGIGLIGAFLAASTIGVLIHLGAVSLPLAEVLVAATVIVAGGLVAYGQRAGSAVWLGLASVAGLFHGYAFGEAIVGAEQTVLGAYLVGLAVVSAAVAATVMTVARRVLTGDATAMTRRTAGAAIAVVGIVMLASGLAG